MTSEWMADALMREWECQSLPRAKERAGHGIRVPADTEGDDPPSASTTIADPPVGTAPPPA